MEQGRSSEPNNDDSIRCLLEAANVPQRGQTSSVHTLAPYLHTHVSMLLSFLQMVEQKFRWIAPVPAQDYKHSLYKYMTSRFPRQSRDFSYPSRQISKCTKGSANNCGIFLQQSLSLSAVSVTHALTIINSLLRPAMPGVGNLRHACQAWHAERFSMARWVNWNTVIMIS
jgi:hypothetical protein